MRLRTRLLLYLLPVLAGSVAILVQRGQQRRYDEQYANRRQALDAARAKYRNINEVLTVAYAIPHPQSVEDSARVAALQAELSAASAAVVQAINMPLPERPWSMMVSTSLVLGYFPLWIVQTRIWYIKRQRRRWRDAVRCVHCGYDVRETPERCPECGNDPKAITPSERQFR